MELLMAKYKKQSPVSQEVIAESMAMAKATQKPGQTKEQTKLIAQGIQKGIELYKKQHKAKVRQHDKQIKQRKKRQVDANESSEDESLVPNSPINWAPWLLLGLSWLGFGLTYWFGLLH